MILSSIVLYIILFTFLRYHEAIYQIVRWDSGIRKVVIFRLDSIGFGVLIAWICYYYEGFVLIHKKNMLFTGLLLLMLSIIVFSYSTLTTRETMFNKTLLFTITNSSLALLLPWFNYICSNNKLTIKLVSYVSITSYSMYLVHLSFVIPGIKKVLMANIPWYLNYVLYYVSTMLISILIYKYFERPITKLREKF
ncbi:hypothetical protein Sps_01969 [Shewanella psychrophila]|uniref:Acyltransferase 3 domain-containing protein n=1 Tax=Shewanella psychrophila TaxID=225848 RepID=A0A1S6HNQ0_9GAMM|nr:hypothetical protein Sps_01969 [Shewanella psychrophila]